MTWKTLYGVKDQIGYTTEEVKDLNNIYIDGIILSKKGLDSLISQIDTNALNILYKKGVDSLMLQIDPNVFHTLYPTLNGNDIIFGSQINVPFCDDTIVVTQFILAKGEYIPHQDYRIYYNKSYGVLVKIIPQKGHVNTFYRLISVKKGKRKLYSDSDLHLITERIIRDSLFFTKLPEEW
ncbi:hypothetical protein [Algoriphagus sp. Y33]|uniref:hypothetical protein n=1 Tax=Algoriphagus sp. Y33 TaxID=2772483 RepID=UPI00177B498F|nr:hypothetical protein [Algoriphagus sp. Y33]